jgi:RNA polymerase sigma-70 factor (ECF subfamily)
MPNQQCVSRDHSRSHANANARRALPARRRSADDNARPEATEVMQAMTELRPLARFWSRNDDEAADLLQNTAERVLRTLYRYRPGTNAGAWVRAIMYHLAIDESRSRCRRHTVLRGYRQELVDACEPPPSDDRESAPPDISEVGRAAERLSAPLRVTFMLWAIERRSYKEIAEHLDIPLSTVATRLLRARAEMRRLLAAGSVQDGGDRGGPGPAYTLKAAQ